jgi:aminopeptidase N
VKLEAFLTQFLTAKVKLQSFLLFQNNFTNYLAAGSVIRMFLYSFTEEVFHKAMHIYLTKNTTNPEGIAEPDDFYVAFQLALKNDNISIRDLFQSWELQAGYPILYVERSYNDGRVRLRQNRFTDDISKGRIWDE